MRQAFLEEINRYLSGAYTDEGISRWWYRPREELDGWTPMEYLESIENKYKKLADLARSVNQ